MVQTIQAKNVTLRELHTKFGLQFVEDENFFREWQDDLPEIIEVEKQRLDRVKTSYSNLLEYPPLLENTVKMVILSPLLDLAGLYLPPFHIKSEKSVEIAEEDEGILLRGQIDVLGVFERFWLVAIESKKAAFSLEVGKPQILAYMLANPEREKPVYGLITNGNSFIFLKLIQGDIPQYALSRLFYILNPGNDLYGVLSILKRLGQLAIETCA
ncbi:MAG: restriction endonuclease subunit R [Cyanobacteriota bacterium]|nr:restriction endonuclease subunit R [Cyanobacteriota bacterium]